jgi:hypothetical protein
MRKSGSSSDSFFVLPAMWSLWVGEVTETNERHFMGPKLDRGRLTMLSTHKQTLAILLRVPWPRNKLWVALSIALVVTLVGGSVAGAGPPADQLRLLALYEPVLLFHSAEDWAPQNVDSYLRLARVERKTTAATWSPVPAPMPTSNLGCLFNPCFRLNLPCALRSGYACYHQQAIRQNGWSNPVMYATAVPVPANTAPPPGPDDASMFPLCSRRIALQMLRPSPVPRPGRFVV